MIHLIVAGAGTMGRVHAEAFRQMDQVKLTAIVDRDLERAQNLAQSAQTGTRAFETLEKAMEACPEAKVIDICLPTFLHKEMVRQAADFVPYVICEKPLAGNVGSAGARCGKYMPRQLIPALPTPSSTTAVRLR